MSAWMISTGLDNPRTKGSVLPEETAALQLRLKRDIRSC